MHLEPPSPTVRLLHVLHTCTLAITAVLLIALAAALAATGEPGAALAAIAALLLVVACTTLAAASSSHDRAAIQELLAELERRATRDPLTGLANRRSFDDGLERELSRSRRDGTTLSLIIFDVDHFKAVNDEHGHPTGDRVLRGVADRLASGVRDIDLPARLGGEEFVLLLPGTSTDDAVVIANRLRHAIASDVTAPHEVTVSAGVASFPRQARSGTELLALADAALYEAKRSGRNRVVAARCPGTGPAPLRTA